jgi:hypothetical protein
MIHLNSSHILAMVLMLTACKESQPFTSKNSVPEHAEEEVQVPTLPERITLTDKLGRSLEAKIVGRTEEEIRFIRLSDSKHFRWKIAQLSEADQEIIRKLPIIVGASDPVSTVQEHLYVENRKKDIDRINKQIRLLESELPGVLKNARNGISPRAKGLQKQIALKKERVATLEEEIEKFNKQ